MTDTDKGAADDYSHASMNQAERVLRSLRESGFDLGTAIGELVDNSYQAGARHIRIKTIRDNTGSIVELAVGDDGRGIPPDLLGFVLSLGYSSHYDQRGSLGRFGLGLKLASLSQAQRIEIFTKVVGEDRIFGTHLDLAEIAGDGELGSHAIELTDWPEKFGDLMSGPDTDSPAASGTLVLWRKIDRLHAGGRFATSVEERIKGLEKFLARAFRRFIDKGLRIELDGREVTLHDPLFLLYNPRVARRFPAVPAAEVVQTGSFKIDGHEIAWTVSLLPREFREKKNSDRSSKGREPFADLYIPDNEGKVSILRNGREISYDLLPQLHPGGREKVDRYIGVEIEFPAALDEYFQVRNVKRGAEPVSKLREELRKLLEGPINHARKDILAYWREVEWATRDTTQDNYSTANDIADRFEQTAPAGRAGLAATAEDVAIALEQILQDLGVDPIDPASAGRANRLRDSLEKHAVTLLKGQAPEKEIVRIKHINGRAIVLVNERHPFIADLVTPLEIMAALDPEELDVATVSELLSRLSVGMDLLLIAYSKAENMHSDPEGAYRDLRMHLGLFAAGLIQEAGRRGR